MSGFSPAQAMIGAMITPALLIMASASLIATALVRLARVVDRVRKLSELGERPRDADEIRRHERRALLAERAVALYFFISSPRCASSLPGSPSRSTMPPAIA